MTYTQKDSSFFKKGWVHFVFFEKINLNKNKFHHKQLIINKLNQFKLKPILKLILHSVYILK